MKHTNHTDPSLAASCQTSPALEAAVMRALGRKPAIAVPDNFAATVTRQLLIQQPVRHARWLGWGPRLALGSAALLTAGMFALAPHAVPSLRNFAFDGELILLAELSGLLLFSGRLLFRD